MAGSKGDFLEARVLDLVLGAVSYSPAGTVYVALFTVIPADSGGGTEVSGGSYARVALTNNTTNWPASTGTNPTVKANGTAITFPKATANWGTIVAFAIFDANSGGNLLYWGSLAANKVINTDDTPSFAVGALTVTED